MSRPSTVASIKEGQGHASDKRRCRRPKGSRKQAGKDRWRERERERKKECATLSLQTRRPDKKLCFFLREREIDGERVCKMKENGILKKDKEDCEGRKKNI